MVDISPTVLAALLGALAGSIGTFSVNWYFWNKRQTTEKRRFKKSLKFELESMSFPEYLSEYGVPDLRTVSAPVYSNNTDKLGYLDEAELEPIVKFYSALNQTQALLDRYEEMRNEGDNPFVESVGEDETSTKGDAPDEVGQIEFTDLIRDWVGSMKDWRETALEELELEE